MVGSYKPVFVNLSTLFPNDWGPKAAYLCLFLQNLKMVLKLMCMPSFRTVKFKPKIAQILRKTDFRVYGTRPPHFEMLRPGCFRLVTEARVAGLARIADDSAATAVGLIGLDVRARSVAVPCTHRAWHA